MSIQTEAEITTKGTAAENKYRIQIVERTLDVLLAFTAESPTQSLEDLANRTGVNKTTLLRIVRTLENSEFLVREADRYRLGSQVLNLSNAYLSTLSFMKAAERPMEHLVERFGQTVSLAVLDDGEVAYVAIEHAQTELGIQGEVGGRHPVHATALGKVLLSGLEAGKARELLASREMIRLTPVTLVTVDDVMSAVERVRQDGYAIDDEERGIGIRCVAAPIHDSRGQIVAAMSIAGSIFHMRDGLLESIVEELLLAVRIISVEMSGSEPPVLV